VIASHYAAPVPRRLSRPTALFQLPCANAPEIGEIAEGEPFDLLDDSLGWAWGYAGADRIVGYVRSECLTH
jgi:hypothetical protein